MEDRDIVALYWQRDQKAIASTAEKYGAYCYTIANNILANQQDSEECVNDTYLAAWNAMPPSFPDLLKPFLAKLTRRLSFNHFKHRTAFKRGGGQMTLVLEELRDCASPDGNPEGEAIAAELGTTIRQFVRALPPREANLFVRRYFFTESVAEAAALCGVSENHASQILSRTRKKLKEYLKQEGFYHE